MRSLVLASLLALACTSANAQTYQVCTNQGNGVSVCVPYTVPPLHRRNYEEEQQRANEDAYNRRAYEYELQLLDRENRRR